MAQGSVVVSAVLLLSSLVLGACSTAPIAMTEATAVPSDRLLRPEGVGDASIVVTRDKGFFGSGCYFALYVNRALAARMAPGEAATFRLSPGEVLLGVGRDPQGSALCSSSLDAVLVQRESMLRAGERKAFRIMLPSSGTPDIVRAD
jgi:hypothetical protein